MINRSNPSVLVSDFISQNPSRTNFAKDEFFFIFGMQNPITFAHFYDESVYKIRFIQRIFYENNSTNNKIIDIPYEKCTESHLPLKTKDFFIKAVYGELSNLICIKKGYDNDFFIEGSYENSFFSHVEIIITSCQNTTESSNCKSQQEINSLLKYGYFAIYTTDTIFDLSNFDNPANIQGRNYYIPTTTDVKKNIVRYIADVQINSDVGWIINDIKSSNHYTFYSDRETFDLLDKTIDKDNVIVDYILRKSTYSKVYTRRYKKIQNVFAEMGGFINLSFIILFFLSKPFANKIYYDTIINKIYNFENDNHNTKEKEKIKFERRRTVEGENIFNLREKKPKIDEIFEPIESPLKITFFQYLCHFFYSSQKGNPNHINIKIEQRKESIRYFNEKMDLNFILKKFLEIEKIKILLMNIDQYHLFQFFPKPLITKNGKILMNCSNPLDISPSFPRKNNKIVSNMDFENKTKTMKKAFLNISAKRNPDNIDKKLMELINDDVKFIFATHKYLENMNYDEKISVSSESVSENENQEGEANIKIEDL